MFYFHSGIPSDKFQIMQVSVIIPTYNHCDYVLQTLESVFAQSFSDYEVIVVNDGSPDNTSHVLAPLVQQGRIRYIEQTNAGQAAARNKGLAQATGEFIAFLDDDDLWPPDKLQWQVEFLQGHPDTIVVAGSVQFVDAQGNAMEEEYFHQRPVTFETLFHGSPFASPGQTLIRAADIKEIGGLNENLWGVDDYDLWFRLSRRGKIAVANQLSLLYRVHPTNASKNAGKMFDNCLGMVKTHLKQAPASQRARLSRNIYRWLYPGLGRRALMDIRIHKLKAFPAVLKDIPYFFYFIIPMLRDRVLLREVVGDFTPKFLHPMFNFGRR